MAAGQGGSEGVEQLGGDGLVLLQDGEAHQVVQVPPQLCLVGLHGAVVESLPCVPAAGSSGGAGW